MNALNTIPATLATDLRFPEGPAFGSDGSLWVVELGGGSLVQIKNGSIKKYDVGGKPNGIAFDYCGKLWFCDAGLNQIRCFDSETEQTTVMVSEVNNHALDGPNDLAFDTSGNLIFTCPGNSRNAATGYICVRTPNGEVKKIAEQLYFPNGLAFSPITGELIIAETYRQRLWKGDWNSEKCEWTNASVFATTNGPTGPDGMAFDGHGNLYVAVYGTGKVNVYNREGMLSNEIILPGNNPTNCAFDLTTKLGLVVTEAERGELLAYREYQY